MGGKGSGRHHSKPTTPTKGGGQIPKKGATRGFYQPVSAVGDGERSLPLVIPSISPHSPAQEQDEQGEGRDCTGKFAKGNRVNPGGKVRSRLEGGFQLRPGRTVDEFMEANMPTLMEWAAGEAITGENEFFKQKFMEKVMDYAIATKKAKIDGISKIGAAAVSAEQEAIEKAGRRVANMSIEELMKLDRKLEGEAEDGDD